MWITLSVQDNTLHTLCDITQRVSNYYTVKGQFFAFNLEKITPGRNFLHRHRLWCLWLIWGMGKCRHHFSCCRCTRGLHISSSVPYRSHLQDQLFVPWSLLILDQHIWNGLSSKQNFGCFQLLSTCFCMDQNYIQHYFWPFRHLIRVMKKHDLTNKKTMTKTKTKTKTMTKTNTFREHLHRAILETCDLWGICS